MPAMAVESGPAAGVVAAALVARQTGRRNLLSFDMGGTTAKASLIRDGQYETTPEYEVGGGASGNRWMHGTGHPIRVPVIDLAEVSAGGGSIAWVDRAGALRVGPEERRRRAGPGLLRPRRHRADRHRLQSAARLSRQGLAAGGRPADRSSPRRKPPLRERARRAARGRRAHGRRRRHRRRQPRHGRSAEDRIGAARPRSARVHAGGVRRRRARCTPRRSPSELGIAEVICPPIPGAFSALGLVGTDLKRDYVRTVYTTTATADPAALEAAFAALEREGAAMLDRAGVAAGAAALRALRRCPLRAPVLRAVGSGAGARARSRRRCAEIADAFHDRHRQTYGHDNRGEPVQLVSVRVAAIGAIPPLPIRQETGALRAPTPSRSQRDRCGSARRARSRPPIYDRGRMPAGLVAPGPGGDRVAGVDHSCSAGLAG